MPANQQNAAISFSAVSKSFAKETVLQSLSLDLPDKQLTAVIGRSGCGKSTLIKMINGLLKPDSGEVALGGAALDYSDLPRLRRGIGYAVQGTGLFPHLSAADNITLLAQLEGWESARIEARMDELLTLVQLDRAILQRFPSQLSGGQQQRVGLCRALILNPPLLLLDEPFAALDPLTRLDVQEQLLAMQQAEPRSCVLVTHDMAEAMRLADNILVMGHGEILAHGDAHTLRSDNPDLDPDHLLLALLEGAGE
jgi:osmoprotectant transport system ATP-binding protein